MTTRLSQPTLAREASGTRQAPRVLATPREAVRAPFPLRCGALLIDYMLFIGILAFSTLIARVLGGGARLAGGTAESFGLLLALLAAFINFGLLAGVRGQTIGKWATGIRIERQDGDPVGIGRAIFRHFIGYTLSLLIFGCGFLLAAFDTRGRALHDRICGTIVVMKRHRASAARRQ